MPNVVKDAEFFVVGGPVPLERSCYVERAADSELENALEARRLVCVLAPPGVGKTSLLHRAAHQRRRSGALVASIVLRESPERVTTDDWLCTFASDVGAALGLGIDIAGWWSAREARPGELRLVDFFWEIVLTNTTAPVVVFIDAVEALRERPLATELFDSLAGCYARREREPDFARLNFVLGGDVSLRHLLGEGRTRAPAAVQLIEPADFVADEAYGLAAAFGGGDAQAQALMDRICVWTGGHPYLTQKVARGVTRKGGRLEDVERVVREQVLAPGVVDGDPVLAHMRARLRARSRSARRAVKLLHKLAAGGRAALPAETAVWDELHLAGAVVAEEGHLRLRNRIVKELVAARWFSTPRRGRRYALAATVFLAALAAGGYWYTRYLPVGDVETLTNPSAPPSAAEESYRRLRALPGFAERADSLFVAALARQSRAALTLADAVAADARLRGLLGQQDSADRLLREFWLRRASEAAHGERRDAALLLAQRAALLPGAEPAAAGLFAELVEEDYANLKRTTRLAAAPISWRMAFAESTLVSFDSQQQLLRTPFGAAAGGEEVRTPPLRLSVLQHVPLERELSIEGEGTAGEFELSVQVAHPATGELLVTLAAPGGAAASFALPHSAGTAGETAIMQAAEGAPLGALIDEGRRGDWRLTVVDGSAGNSGLLLGWGLTFGADTSRDDAAEPWEIPDPTRSEDVAISVAGDRAVVRPTAAGAIGSVALWNLVTAELEHDFTLPGAPREVAINATGTRLLAATERELTLWDVADGTEVARVETQAAFVLPAVFSPDGGYVAIAEQVEGANPLYSVLRSADASLVASSEGPIEVVSWQLGPGARYLAVVGPPTVVRVLDTRGGAELRRIELGAPVDRVVPLADGAAVVTIAGDGQIASWPLADARAPARLLGRTPAPTSVSVAAEGARLAFSRADGAISVVDARSGAEIARLREPRGVPVATAQLSSAGTELVTQSGAQLRYWTLPTGSADSSSAAVERVPTAVAIDATGEIAVVGLATGQVLIGAAAVQRQRDALAYFGHRGPVTAAALRVPLGLAVTGGRDGVVRVWDVVAGAPQRSMAVSTDAPVETLALSPDGRHVASGAGRSVRVANVVDGVITVEWPMAGAVTALAFAADSRGFVAGDDSGAIVLVSLDAGRSRVAAQTAGAVTALAFAADGLQIAMADAARNVGLIGVADGVLRGAPWRSPSPVRWLEFRADGGALFAVTDTWLHSLALAPALAPTESRLIRLPAVSLALAVTAAGVRVAGLDHRGAFDIAAIGSPGVFAPVPAALAARDWPTALGLRLDDNGEAAPFTP